MHWEDQLASEKKCGHMGGKVLVPTSQHVRTLNAARLAADISGCPDAWSIARTDALAADLLTSDVDEIDQPFLTGERTAEGFYRVRSGLEPVLARAKAYAPYSDLIWVETGTPDLGLAREFATELHKEFPGKMLAYNCSPSFNWKSKLSDDEIATFQDELGELGYKFQFITLAGFHALNHSMFNLAQGYAKTGMTRLRRAAGARVRGRGQRLHRRQAPGRGRHRLLRQGRHRPQPGQRHPRAEWLHRRRAVPLR